MISNVDDSCVDAGFGTVVAPVARAIREEGFAVLVGVCSWLG